MGVTFSFTSSPVK